MAHHAFQPEAASQKSAGPVRGGGAAAQRHPAAARLLALQHTTGNASVARLLAPSPRTAPAVQRDCACGGTCQNCRARASVPEDESIRILEGRGAGNSMQPEVRRSMEAHFGHDFSSVRVHTDAHADRTTESINASAYTVGRDIFFRNGEYRPDSTSGQRLLAHELTHVVQQGAQDVPSSAELRVNRPDDALEHEADRVANTVMTPTNGDDPPAALSSGGLIARRTVERLVQRGNTQPGGTKAASGQPPAGQPQKPVVKKRDEWKRGAVKGGDLQIHRWDGTKWEEHKTLLMTAKLMEWKGKQVLGARFAMLAKFTPEQDGGTDCGCGEYRQEVKGERWRGDTDDQMVRVQDDWISHKDYWEDRSRDDHSAYGYRLLDDPPSAYQPDYKGCDYIGYDSPLTGGKPGQKVRMLLQFRGRLIDRCNDNKVIAEKQWSVVGSEKIPEAKGP